MKLSFAPRTRSVRARWILEEIGAPYELVRVDPAKESAPVLVDGETVLTESLAICLYLAERQLAPAIGSVDRGAYLQWMVIAEVTLDSLVLERYRRVEPAEPARLNEVLTLIDARLDGREFIVGEAFTAADVVMASILHLAHTLQLLEAYPKLFEYVLRHCKRPASRRAVT